MLYFSRWKTVATLLTAFIVCAFAIPNFFPEQTVQKWPKWAQRHIVLGLDLQGGSHLLLAVGRALLHRDPRSADDEITRIEPQFDIYNALNASPVLAVNTNYGAAFLRPTQILAGRLLKFYEEALEGYTYLEGHDAK